MQVTQDEQANNVETDNGAARNAGSDSASADTTSEEKNGKNHSAQSDKQSRQGNKHSGANHTRSALDVENQHGLIFFFGVVLPILAVLFETSFHFCARHFFDPFPSANHVVLFLLIPFNNYLTLLASRRNLSAHYSFMSLASGMAMGMAAMYSLMFLPLFASSLFFVGAFGFGLLGLAPALALPFTWLSGKKVCKLSHEHKTYFNAHQVEHIGHLIILVMVLAIELPSTLTRVYLGISAEPATEIQGIAWLRKYGSEEVMLRACYERSGRATDIIGSVYEAGHPLPITTARKIFYRVTGKPFNSVAIPASARATIQHALVNDPGGLNAKVEDEFDLDTDIAGEGVSGVARGLSIADSVFSGNVDGNAMLADLDWTFSFANVSRFDREARSKIMLPPGAVVTRATLILNDKEHDAKIMVREAARQIYHQSVMQHKDDPLLVSMSAIDQVLVQCYPVHPHCNMKVKLHIVCPLAFDKNGNGSLALPSFSEMNFAASKPSEIKLSSQSAISASSENNETLGKKDLSNAAKPTWSLETQETSSQLANSSLLIHATRNPECKTVWCINNFERPAAVLQRNVHQTQLGKPGKLTVIIDGSISMKDSMPSIIEGLKSMPSSMPTTIVVVQDGARILCDKELPGTDAYGKALTALATIKPTGGQDNSFELLKAINAVKENNLSADAVLWLHAAQPIAEAGNNYARTQYLSHIPRIPQMARTRTMLNIAPYRKQLMRCVASHWDKNLDTDLNVILSLGKKGEVLLVRAIDTTGAKPDNTEVEKRIRGIKYPPLPEAYLGNLITFKLDLRQLKTPELMSLFGTAAMNSASSDSSSDSALPGAHVAKDEPKDVIRNRPEFYDLQVSNGPVEFLNAYFGGPTFKRIEKIGTVADDLTQLSKNWQTTPKDTIPEFEVKTAVNAELTPTSGPVASATALPTPTQAQLPSLPKEFEASSSLAQLYAYQKVINNGVSSSNVTSNNPYFLSHVYHLISPVSSAVVSDDIAELTPLPPPPPNLFAEFFSAKTIENGFHDTSIAINASVHGIQNAVALLWNMPNLLNTSISASFGKMESQLNRLNAVGGTGNSNSDGYDSYGIPFNSESKNMNAPAELQSRPPAAPQASQEMANIDSLSPDVSKGGGRRADVPIQSGAVEIGPGGGGAGGSGASALEEGTGYGNVGGNISTDIEARAGKPTSSALKKADAGPIGRAESYNEDEKGVNLAAASPNMALDKAKQMAQKEEITDSNPVVTDARLQAGAKDSDSASNKRSDFAPGRLTSAKKQEIAQDGANSDMSSAAPVPHAAPVPQRRDAFIPQAVPRAATGYPIRYKRKTRSMMNQTGNYNNNNNGDFGTNQSLQSSPAPQDSSDQWVWLGDLLVMLLVLFGLRKIKVPKSK